MNKKDNSSVGANLAIIGANTIAENESQQFLKNLKDKVYIGIDFGTSTTVASYIKMGKDGSIVVEPIEIPQQQPDGRISRFHLVPTCIAINPNDNNVIFGIGAKELQYDLQEGINVWSSFKMGLGVNLGAQYRNTRLKSGKHEIVIEKPQDAAREFFKYLRDGIFKFLDSNRLPKNIALAVSVPASFEANQRKDLLRALNDAGFNLDESCLIDEPNAAFLSVLHESWQEKSNFVDHLKSKSKNLIVFDFGAGTCDISILRTSISENSVKSKNLSISRFIALGGNNIDREIVEKVLIPQMLSQSEIKIDITSEQMNQLIIPRLMPVAERLKIACAKNLATRRITTIEECELIHDAVTEHDVDDISIGANKLSLKTPNISFIDFGRLMKAFLSTNRLDNTAEQDGNNRISVFAPITSALAKANIEKDQLDALIFIGGSSENPLVQGALKSYFGRFIYAIIPRDLRTHVSQGAALHAFALHAFGANIIQPITSESIMLVTANGLETILESGSEVPTIKPFISRFVVRDSQETIKLPICVTSEDKILSVLSISPKNKQNFKQGESVIIECGMTINKLLEIVVTVGDEQTVVEQLNPLANTALTDNESKFLLAKQRLNNIVLNSNGKPPIGELISYARIASSTGHYLLAAEMYEQIERMDSNRNFSVDICYNYDRASKSSLAEKWANIAYERNKSATSAFNAAIFKERSGNIQEAKNYLQEALTIDPNYAAAHVSLGEILEDLNESSHEHFEKAKSILERELIENRITISDCNRLARVSRQLGDTKLANQAELFADKMRKGTPLYDTEHLVGVEGNKVTKTN